MFNFAEKEKFRMYKINKDRIGLLFQAIFALLISCILLSACAETRVIGAPINHASLEDGTYEGSFKGGPNKALVKVTIKDSNISYIEIVEHQAWKGKKAELTIVERIIVNQSTKVDAVSGATNSSRVIMNAVQNAIEKAYRN
jgi:uncharacterized protein with FMN-binding domain